MTTYNTKAYNLMANFEVTGITKQGKQTVRYYTLPVYEGVTTDLHERVSRMGIRKIRIRMI